MHAGLVEGKRQRVLGRGGKKGEKSAKAERDGTAGEGIKSHLRVTIAAMTAAANLVLRANAARPRSHPNGGERSLSSSILHRHFDIYLTCLRNRPTRPAPHAPFAFPEL